MLKDSVLNVFAQGKSEPPLDLVFIAEQISSEDFQFGQMQQQMVQLMTLIETGWSRTDAIYKQITKMIKAKQSDNSSKKDAKTISTMQSKVRTLIKTKTLNY